MDLRKRKHTRKNLLAGKLSDLRARQPRLLRDASPIVQAAHQTVFMSPCWLPVSQRLQKKLYQLLTTIPQTVKGLLCPTASTSTIGKSSGVHWWQAVSSLAQTLGVRSLAPCTKLVHTVAVRR